MFFGICVSPFESGFALINVLADGWRNGQNVFHGPRRFDPNLIFATFDTKYKHLDLHWMELGRGLHGRRQQCPKVYVGILKKVPSLSLPYIRCHSRRTNRADYIRKDSTHSFEHRTLRKKGRFRLCCCLFSNTCLFIGARWINANTNFYTWFFIRVFFSPFFLSYSNIISVLIASSMQCFAKLL